MRARVEDGSLWVVFEDGKPKVWNLPSNMADREENRRVRDLAITFANAQGATQGQIHAIMKAMSDAGYYVTGPKRRLK